MSERKLLKLNNKYVLDALCMLRSCSLKDTRFTTQNEQFYEVYDYIKELEEKIDKAIKEIKENEFYIYDDILETRENYKVVESEYILEILGDKE